MALTYLEVGDAFDSTKANALYAEFERKTALILSNKSPFLAAHIRPGIQHLLGRLVYFVSGFQAYTSGETTHDEADYDAAVAGATVSSYDDTLHIANCNETTPDLDGSLIVRTVERLGIPYFLKQALNRQEKRHPYAVLDVVVEGPETLAFPATWDKYGCIRLHNCNLWAGLAVTFAGEFPESATEIVITVPRGESRTIRIDRNAAGTPIALEECGKYFWHARPGDPFPVGPKNTPYFPEASYKASNILNPRLALAWIEALKTPDITDEMGWEIDETVLQDVEGSYRTTYYADPETSTTLLGNLIHHQGDLFVERTGYDATMVRFGGYGVALPSLVEIVSDGTGGYRIQRTDTAVTYVSGSSTNLLEDGSGAHGTINLTSGTPIALAKTVELIDPAQAARWVAVYPGDTDPFELVIHTATEEIEVTADWLDGTDTPQTVTGTYDQLTGTPESPVVYEFTAAQAVSALNAKSAAMQLDAAGLTPLGPTFVFDRPLDVSLPGWVWHAEQQALRLKAHGWPTWDFDNDITGASAPVHRQVLWPRPPQLIRPAGVTDPPDATGLGDTLDGAPWAVAAATVALPVAYTANRFLMPLGDMASEGDTLTGAWWRAWTWDSKAIRVPRTAEEYNWLAWRINQLKRGRPLSLGDILFTMDGGTTTLVPDAPSYQVPVDHFCTAEAALSTQEALISACSATYATEDDFPTRYHDLLDIKTAGGTKIVNLPAIPVENSAPSVSYHDSAWWVDWTETYGTPYLDATTTTGETVSGVNEPTMPVDEGYRYVSDATASAVAAAAGVPMIRTRIGSGRKLVTESPSAPTQLWETHIASQARSESFEFEWQADAFAAALPTDTVVNGGAFEGYNYGQPAGENIDTLRTRLMGVPALTEGDIDFIQPYDSWGVIGTDRTREALATAYSTEDITKSAFKSVFYSNFTEIAVACWQATWSARWWSYFAGNQQTVVAITTFTDGFGLRSYSRAGLTPTYLFQRAVPSNTSESEHDRLTSLYGTSDPREPTYISPAVDQAQIVTWTGNTKVLIPPGTAKAALAYAELIVGVDLEWLGD